MNEPGGFYRGNPAEDRIWKAESGKAAKRQNGVHRTRYLNANGLDEQTGRYTLVTLQSNDQFNTTIYGHSDRLRGLEGSRLIVLMNPEDMQEAGLEEASTVTLVTDCDTHQRREVRGLTVIPFDLPRGCLAGYFAELNPLIPLGHHDILSKTPAAKGVPVKIEAS